MKQTIKTQSLGTILIVGIPLRLNLLNLSLCYYSDRYIYKRFPTKELRRIYLSETLRVYGRMGD